MSSLSKSQRFNSHSKNENFKVVIRVRPPLPRELSGEIPFQNVIRVDENEQMITICENVDSVVDEQGQVMAHQLNGPYTVNSFVFDHVYDQYTTQEKLYDTTARAVVDSALQGYNSTIFAYGQTGTGKTFTMEGFQTLENRGIIPRAITQIFDHIKTHANDRMRFLVRASYLQIYNEHISDLLKPERNNLQIREDKKRGVFVEGLSEWVVRSPAEIFGLMQRGGAVRATGETKMNEMSSRSHAVFVVIAEQSETIYVDENGNPMSAEKFNELKNSRSVRRGQDMIKLEDHVRQSFKVGKLNLVDLAGSERVSLSGATGQRFEEMKQINLSLTHLGNVISALTDSTKRSHIPYRDSKLTRMLEDSLGGNCKTTMMAMISPALEAMGESLSTLKFAHRAKSIRNEARVNEDLDQKSLLRKYERELKQLRAELEERSKNVVDKRRLLELEEQKKRAEADKNAAFRALEVRSQEVKLEKEEKKKLEQRIAMLMNQMIRGDGALAGSDAPVIQSMKEQHDKLRQEYENKLALLEQERGTIEEEKAQVEKYKQLLLKQRDIMIALTQRLVERDEQIMQLQTDLEVSDRQYRDMEEKLDEKTAQLISLQRITNENQLSIPTSIRMELVKVFDQIGNENKEKDDISIRDQPTEVFEDYESRSRANSQSIGGALVNATPSTTNKTTTRINKAKLQQHLDVELDSLLKVNQDLVTNVDNRTKLSQIIYKLIQNLDDKGIFNGNDPSSLRQNNGSDNIQLALEVQRLKLMNESLEQRVREQATQNYVEEIKVVNNRCDTLVKEREAIQTIMEQKIKVLVQNVALSANSLTNSSHLNTNAISEAQQSLMKDIGSLQRLINASIQALRNAANTNTNTNTNTNSNTNSMTSTPASIKSTIYTPNSYATERNNNSTIPSRPISTNTPNINSSISSISSQYPPLSRYQTH